MAVGASRALCYSCVPRGELAFSAFRFLSGRSAAWLARLVRDQEVEGSNPFAPTTHPIKSSTCGNRMRFEFRFNCAYGGWNVEAYAARFGHVSPVGNIAFDSVVVAGHTLRTLAKSLERFLDSGCGSEGMCCDNDEKRVLQPARIRFPLEPYGEVEECCVGLIADRAGCRRVAPSYGYR